MDQFESRENSRKTLNSGTWIQSTYDNLPMTPNQGVGPATSCIVWSYGALGPFLSIGWKSPQWNPFSFDHRFKGLVFFPHFKTIVGGQILDSLYRLISYTVLHWLSKLGTSAICNSPTASASWRSNGKANVNGSIHCVEERSEMLWEWWRIWGNKKQLSNHYVYLIFWVGLRVSPFFLIP